MPLVLLLAPILLLAAQDVPAGIGERDTIDLPNDGYRFCRFRQVPELQITIPTPKWPGVLHSFRVEAREKRNNTGFMDQGGWFSFYIDKPLRWGGVRYSSVNFTLNSPELKKAPAASAEFLLDGRPIAVDLLINHSGLADLPNLAGPPGDSVRLERSEGVSDFIRAIAHGKTVTVRVYAAGHQLLEERNFDVSHIHLIEMALSAANWGCG